jgi:peroxin-2
MRSLTSSVTLKSVFDALPGSAARRIGSTTSKITDAASQTVGSYYLLPPNECAICAQNAAFDITRLGSASGAITATYPEVSSAPAEKAGVEASAISDQPPSYPLNTAYMTSCGHLYCYVCLSDAMLRAKDDGGPPWECLRCAQAVTWSERAEVDVENSEGNADSMDEYEFSTEPDSESLGDSIGSSQGFTFANSEDSQ